MMNTGAELITLVNQLNYEPTFISTDKRAPAGAPTTIGYQQIGEVQQYGFAKGPVFKVEFVDFGTVTSPTHVKIWGIDNKDSDAPIYPISYLLNFPTITVYLKKFDFCDSTGASVAPDAADYTIVGYKKRGIPIAW